MPDKLLNLKSPLSVAMGLIGSWGTTAVSFFADGVGVMGTDIPLLTLLSGCVSSIMTLSVAYAKYVDSQFRKSEAKYKDEETRKMSIENDKAELELKILQIQMNGDDK